MKENKKRLLASEDCFGLVAAAILIDDYGTEALNWLPEVIAEALEENYSEINQTVENKLFAAVHVLTNDDYRILPDRFLLICNALTKGINEDRTSDLFNISWGLVEAELLDPPEEKKKKPAYSSTILKIVELAHLDYGIYVSAPTLRLSGININLMPEALEDFANDPEGLANVAEVIKSKTIIQEDWLRARLRELQSQIVYAGFKHVELEEVTG